MTFIQDRPDAMQPGDTPQAPPTGRFFVLDGTDGSGKSTQQTLLARFLEAEGQGVVCCRDPGGTPIGDRIRSVLLDHDLETMDVHCETLLFMASRAQLCAEVIRPAIEAGKVVVCDRFVSATCAYQGAAGFDAREVIELARHAIDDGWPDLTLLIDVDTETAFQRIGRSLTHTKPAKRNAGQTMLFHDAVHDAMESRSVDYHRRVRENFLSLATYYPAPVEVIDGTADAETVHQRVVEALRRHGLTGSA